MGLWEGILIGIALTSGSFALYGLFRHGPIQLHAKLDTPSIDVSYNENTDILTIEGKKYAGQIFREFGFPTGDMFVRIHTDSEDVVVIEKAPFDPTRLKVFPIEVQCIPADALNGEFNTPLVRFKPVPIVMNVDPADANLGFQPDVVFFVSKPK